MVINSTPAHASSCQSLNGLIAKRKMVIGRLAIGSARSVLQNWFDSAVKAARDAFPSWSATAPKDRAALLLKLADRIDAQRALGRLGYDVGNQDGVLGVRTRKAVKAWQKTAGLPADVLATLN